MVDWIIGGGLAVLVGLAIAYIVKQKKKGVRCIGCSQAGACSAHHGGCSGCSGTCE